MRKKHQYLLQTYDSVSGYDKGEWCFFKKVRIPFTQLCMFSRDYTKRTHVNTRILHYRSDRMMATFSYNANKEFRAVFSSAGEQVLALERAGRQKEAERAREADEVDEPTKGDELRSDIAESRAIARKQYNEFYEDTTRGYPAIYRCQGCRLYFARATRKSGAKCSYCQSGKVKRIK